MMPTTHASKIGLNLFLLKDKPDSPNGKWAKEDYLSTSQAADGVARTVRHKELQFASGEIRGTLFIKDPPSERVPEWAAFINDGLNEDLAAGLLTNKSVSALLVLDALDRQFVIAFGHGRHMLEHRCIDTRFGLRVCLNTIEPGKIASIDKQTFDANPRLTRTQATKLSAISAYGVMAEQDLLKAVVGVTSDAYSSDLGSVVAGMDSLKMTLPAEATAVYKAMCTALAQSKSKEFLKKVGGKDSQFAWVNNLTHETDDSIVEDLNSKVWAEFKSGALSKMWLAAPEIVDWSNVAGFSYWPVSSLSTFSPFLDIVDFRKTFNRNSTLSTLRSRRIYYKRLSDNSEGSYLALNCLYWETIHQGHIYILHQGQWYKIDPNFASATHNAYRRIPIKALPPAFPHYSHDNEGDYNAAVSKQKIAKYALLDKKMITFGGGPSSIEVCDLLLHSSRVAKGELVHVKRGRESATLSHLFNQGLVSCTLLASAPDFVKQVNSQIAARGFKVVPSKFPCGQYDVVYAIVDGSAASAPADVPFFSKITLLACIRSIEAFGFKVYLMRIPEATAYIATKVATRAAKKAAKDATRARAAKAGTAATAAKAAKATKQTKTAKAAKAKTIPRGVGRSIKIASRDTRKPTKPLRR